MVRPTVVLHERENPDTFSVVRYTPAGKAAGIRYSSQLKEEPITLSYTPANGVFAIDPLKPEPALA